MKTKETDLLRLNLQFFAEEPPAEPPAPTYTQADIDRIVGERLAREKAKADKAVEEAKAEAERKRLEEESEFKTLYEQSQARIAEIEAQAKAAELAAKKQSLLLEAGYSADKLADVLPFIMGADEDEVKASVERFKAVAPPTPAYVDPATGGGGRQQPEQKDPKDLGRELFKNRKK
ncbi:DUF4355 domain-containing protein [Sporosarcina sp. ACRSL]|uniref:capsid assembly scaffolding protein Gp46 family protein n=1 Tax=Sporosarcina sp. ACRSL TaxID=2918215 RepID=UPI001EF543F7|nr:DUF4355 domain-containing protein [Sporosarcina sp. ACRSL]MCG7345317.1 DUF4355 domain-containing protein [Sporosarcina sp. ACRSL]